MVFDLDDVAIGSRLGEAQDWPGVIPGMARDLAVGFSGR